MKVPAWAEDGMVVFIPEYGYVRGVVRAALGDTARVVSEAYQIDKWFRLEELRVKDGDDHQPMGWLL